MYHGRGRFNPYQRREGKENQKGQKARTINQLADFFFLSFTQKEKLCPVATLKANEKITKWFRQTAGPLCGCRRFISGAAGASRARIAVCGKVGDPSQTSFAVFGECLSANLM